MTYTDKQRDVFSASSETLEGSSLQEKIELTEAFLELLKETQRRDDKHRASVVPGGFVIISK